MLQVLANLMMDPPTGEEHEATRDQKANLLKAVRPLDAASVVRGQYRGYRKVPGVRPDSNVETYVAIKLFVDSWRWAGVPIYIRAGKCLPLTAAEVVVQFKDPPRATFCEGAESFGHMRMRIGPDVSIAMGLRVKRPGERMSGENVELTSDGAGRLGDASLSAPARRCDAGRRRAVRPTGHRRRSMADRRPDSGEPAALPGL